MWALCRSKLSSWTGLSRNRKALLAKYGVVRPEVQEALDKMGDIPVDIEPKFATAE